MAIHFFSYYRFYGGEKTVYVIKTPLYTYFDVIRFSKYIGVKTVRKAKIINK